LHERLSFYIPRDSRLHQLNPLSKLLLSFTLIILAFFTAWYWTAPLLILIAIIPLAFLGKVHLEYMRAALRLLAPVMGFLFVMQSLFYPGGKTVLVQFFFLHLTVESIQFAFLTATRIFVMVSAFILLLLTTHPSELMSDLVRRGMPGTLSYVIISTLQIIPQMQAKAATIIAAQRSRGLDTEGSFRKRVGALVPLVSPLVFGSLVEVEERAIAIEARAFSSTLPKTSLRLIPDSRFDKVIRWVFVLLMIAAITSRLWLSLI